MLDNILVPLDGSPLSDRVVGLLRRILVRKDAAVTLVEVVPMDGSGRADPAPRLAEARNHLERVARPLRDGGARVQTDALAGDPAERVLNRSVETPTSLIVLATHGRTGLERFTRGSVAERILRGSKAPVLLANPFGLDAARELRFKKI